MSESEYSDYSLRKKVFALLKKNHTLKPSMLLKMLSLSSDRRGTITQYRKQWKREYKLGLGSNVQGKPNSFHKARGWVYVDRLSLDREKALGVGWIQSRNRNKVLIFKDPKGLGRMEWHWKSGRVNIFPRQPPIATKGRVWQLFCNGFSMNGLIDSMQILDLALKSISFKGATAVWDLGVKVPYFVIDFFKLSNGLILKGGDLSHPTGIEAEFCLPDFVEKSEAQLERNTKIIEEFLKLLRGEQTTIGKPEDLSKLPNFYNR